MSNNAKNAVSIVMVVGASYGLGALITSLIWRNKYKDQEHISRMLELSGKLKDTCIGGYQSMVEILTEENKELNEKLKEKES